MKIPLVLSMERNADGIHYEVNPKEKRLVQIIPVLCRHQSQAVDNSVNKFKNSVDIASKMGYKLADVDKRNQNVDKTVYKSNKCGYTEGFSPVCNRKTHQIRVAFSHIGHPLVGDTLYGTTYGARRSNYALKRLYLHTCAQASVLWLPHNLI